ncbi:acetyl-CoA synthetase-like protein [Polychaeton citri CBS 116435]|uniref:Acetyl-CoA synthetase-like protein n=1 Tax=Polychaeton citri CBS 116435 TaxID=1314669 RepID=A0A9P4QG26_9PEZI|nr:acetyl-CoA synthetase-like protein [Polychaeton citri CBS 116435]
MSQVLIDADNPGRFVTPRLALELVLRIVAKRPFEPGAVVCLHLSNDVLYPVLYLAILASGCIWTGTNTAYTEQELSHHFTVSRTQYVITTSEELVKVDRALRATSQGHSEIVVFSDLLRDWLEGEVITESLPGVRPGSVAASLYAQCRTLHDLVESGDGFPRVFPFAIDDSEIAVLMQTSGTTGLSKMAARTHKAIIAECKAIEDNNASKDYVIRRLLTTPIFHGFSKPLMIISPLKFGHTTYIMKRFDSRYPDLVHDYGITETAAPPPMLLKFVNYESHVQQKLLGLRMIYTGGSTLPSSLRRQTLAMFTQDPSSAMSPPRIVQVWGMTEGGWFTTFKYPEGTVNSPEDFSDGSVGRPIDGVSITVDGSGHHYARLDNGQRPGELLIRSKHLMESYLGDMKTTHKTIVGGYLRTGDIGYVLNGKVYLVDRKKDLIKVNGWQVSPAEIENALLQFPGIADVAVVGTGTGVSERPLCFVVPKSDITVDDIKECLRRSMARYKVASVEVKFTDEIPRSGAGKVRKQDLKRLATEMFPSKGSD